MRKLLTFRRRFKFGNPGGPDDRCTSWGPAKRFIDALPGVVRNGGAVDGEAPTAPVVQWVSGLRLGGSVG
jgi:hypothetical protein